MNYSAMKSMIETIVQTYSCNNCKSKINENDIDVVGAAGSSVNIDIKCSNCKQHFMIKSEVLAMDLNSMSIPDESLKGIKNQLLKAKDQFSESTKKEDLIKDEEIVDLNKDLKKNNFGASDLFKD